MAVVTGTNSGFVSSAPVADPTASFATVSATAIALKGVAPAGATKITEIGWWCDNATEETNFEVGLYNHNAGDDNPEDRLYVDTTNAKGTGAGWKTVTVDWAITAGTTYWVALQVDTTGTITRIDITTPGGGSDYFSYKGTQTTLTDPWGASAEYTYTNAVYALYESGAAEYDEGTKTVTGTGIVSLASEIIHWDEGILVVTASGIVILGAESYRDITGWPNPRASDYDPDLYWDEATETWGSSRVTIPGAFAEYLVAVGEEGEVYFGTV